MSSHLFVATTAIGVVLLFSILYSLVGELILRNFFDETKRLPGYCRYGLGFFLGSALAMTLWRLLAYFLHSARLSFWLSTILCLLPLMKLKFWFPVQDRNKIRVFLTALPVIFVLTLFYWLPGDSPLDSNSTLGSLHSGRYVQISSFVLKYDFIPKLGQNYEQSLLAVIPGFLGVNRPYLALAGWIAVSNFALLLCVFGFLRTFGIETKRASLGTLLVMAGNTALSVLHLRVLDSQLPIILNGYSDSIRSVGSLLVCYAVLAQLQRKKTFDWKMLLVFAVLIGSWQISAVQNIFFLGFLLLGLVAFRRDIRMPAFLVLASVVILTGVLREGGGMISPLRSRTYIAIEGLQYFAATVVSFAPGVSYNVLSDIGPICPSSESMLLLGTQTNSVLRMAYWVHYLESTLWNGLRIYFVPLLSILVMGFCLRVSRKRDLERELLFQFAAAGALVVLFGVYPFTVNGMKWELSRFGLPLCFFGALVGVIALEQLTPKKHRRLIWALATVVLLTGPGWETVRTLHVYLNASAFREVLHIILTTG